MESVTPLVQDMIHYRGLERILIILGGLAAILLGGLLYKWGILDKTDVKVGGGQIAPSVVLRNASPGIVFCLFGAIVLIWALKQQIVWQQDGKAVGDAVKDIPSEKILFSPKDQEDLGSFLDTIARYEAPPGKDEFKNIQESARKYRELLRKGKEGQK